MRTVGSYMFKRERLGIEREKGGGKIGERKELFLGVKKEFYLPK